MGIRIRCIGGSDASSEFVSFGRKKTGVFACLKLLPTAYTNATEGVADGEAS
jgi:hypothetical protein